MTTTLSDSKQLTQGNIDITICTTPEIDKYIYLFLTTLICYLMHPPVRTMATQNE